MKSLVFSLLILISLCFSSPFVSALSVKSLNLRQIVGLSNRIFKGTVTDIKVEDDPFESGYLVEYTTFKVEECMKGDCSAQMVIKQMAQGPYTVPKYEAGKTYLLFFPPDSENTGLVAPVGIWQGLFPLEKKNGSWVVPALQGNARLVKELKSESKALSMDLPALQQSSNPNDYKSFKAVIEKIVEDTQ